jgi:REP element-mobilizing transposase RayT
LRIEFPGAVYHVMSRGNGRQPIFLGDEDRERFLDVLARVVRRFGWRLHAYCLMGNHYHLVLDTPEPNLSRGMRTLNGEATQESNRRHLRCGHLFQGRFASVVVEKERHLLELCRYVVLNPVRARGMKVSAPEDWPWSSYRATAGLEAAPGWLHTEWLLRRFGGNRPSSREGYRAFVRQGIGGASPLAEVRGGLVLGSESFAASIWGHRGDVPVSAEHPRAQRTAHRPGLDRLISADISADRERRDGAIALAHLEYGYTQKAIADHAGLHYATVCRIIKREEERNARNKT